MNDAKTYQSCLRPSRPSQHSRLPVNCPREYPSASPHPSCWQCQHVSPQHRSDFFSGLYETGRACSKALARRGSFLFDVLNGTGQVLNSFITFTSSHIQKGSSDSVSGRSGPLASLPQARQTQLSFLADEHTTPQQRRLSAHPLSLVGCPVPPQLLGWREFAILSGSSTPRNSLNGGGWRGRRTPNRFE